LSLGSEAKSNLFASGLLPPVAVKVSRCSPLPKCGERLYFYELGFVLRVVHRDSAASILMQLKFIATAGSARRLFNAR
jgi:hypothetical protein